KASRDLAAAGILALPFLRTALADPDIEVRHRARACLRQIDEAAERALVVAGARVLAERRPPGAAAALLACLPEPTQENEELWEAFRPALARSGTPDAALPAALADRDPARRAAAAFVLGRRALAQRPAVRRLLAAPEPLVRLHAAWGLLKGGDGAAVPALI